MGALTDADAPIKIKFLGEVQDKVESLAPLAAPKMEIRPGRHSAGMRLCRNMLHTGLRKEEDTQWNADRLVLPVTSSRWTS